MAISTGTALDYHDVLDKLRLFVIAQGWTVLRWAPGADIFASAELVVRPIGTGSFRPAITISTRSDAPEGKYHWFVSQSQEFDLALSQLNQPATSAGAFTPLSNNSLTYWFYVNDRRVICVFKMGLSYSSMYAGLFLPYAFPNEYRRPFYIAGNTPTARLVEDTNSLNSFIADPGDGAAYYMNREDLWVTTANRDSNANTEPSYINSSSRAFLWPKKTSVSASVSISSSTGSWNYNAMNLLKPNLAGEMPLFQCQIIDPTALSNAGAIIGALDGVYDTGGFSRVAEQVVTFGGSNFRLFPNMHRMGPAYFMAIEEI